ncbi:MAG: glycosyltransferase family 2 protein [Clostridia bacterium]|nr:glycosyltransferase family 2 protein [Clostridia bacterium]
MDKKVGLIIPAFNEQPRISAVLDVVTDISLFEDILVVDDGSEDDTFKVAKKYDIKAIRNDENLGKGAAMQRGLQELEGMDLYVFLDADLIGLKEDHIKALISPFFEDDEMDMSVGQFKDMRKKSVDLAQKYFSILNGQRALSSKFVEILPDMSWSRFGVEVLLSKYANLTDSKVCFPILEDISHYTKEEKFGFKKGFAYRLQMYKEVMYSLFNHKKYIGLSPETYEDRMENLNR